MKRKYSDPFDHKWVIGHEDGRLSISTKQKEFYDLFDRIKDGDIELLRSLDFDDIRAYHYGYGMHHRDSSVIRYILNVKDEAVRHEMLRHVFERLSLADPKCPYDVHIAELMSENGILDNFDFLTSIGFDFAQKKPDHFGKEYPRVFWPLNLYKLHERWTISFRLLNTLKKLIEKGIEPHYAAIGYPPLQNCLLKHRFFTRFHRAARPLCVPFYLTRMICRMADYGGPFSRELTGFFDTDCRRDETASLSFDRLDLGVHNCVSMQLDAIHPSLHDRFNAWSKTVALHAKSDLVKRKVLMEFAKMDRYLNAQCRERQFLNAIEAAEEKLKSD